MQNHGGNLTEISRKYGIKKDDIIDFSSNINPLGFPDSVKALFGDKVNEIMCYPDTNSTELKEEIAKWHGIEEKNRMVGNGSTELIYLIARVFNPKRALIPVPAFGEYERSLTCVRCELRYLPLKEKNYFRPDVDEILALLPQIDILYLCNPNNPTGILSEKNEILPLIDEAGKRDVLIVMDEAFMDFADNESVTDEIRRRENLIVIRSLTKFFGIPGLRLGYLIAGSKLVDKISHYKEPWTVNVLAQKAGIACFKDNNFRLRTKRFIDRERKYFLTELSKLEGVKPYASSTNYILTRIVKSGLSSGRLYELMAGQGLLIRDCRSFRGLGNKFIRVAVKKRKNNDLLIKHLKKVLER
jgi:threonine-phosphate decarboxylase